MRVGVIGCGSAGSRHSRNLVELGHTPLLYDASREKAARAASEVGTDVEVLADLQALFDAGLDACIVASPTHLHARHALEALTRSIPVLIEKPLATSTYEAKAVVDAAASSRIPVMVGYNLRFLTATRRAKEELVSDRIGKPVAAAFRFGYDLRLWRPSTDYRTTYSGDRRTGGGVLLEASHELDLAAWLLGPASAVTARVARTGILEGDFDDLAFVVVEHEGGALASHFLDMLSPTYRRGFEIVGESGRVSWDWGTGVLSTEAPRAGGAQAGRTTEQIPADLGRSYVAEVAYFLDCVEKGEAPEPGPREGLETLRLVEAVESSSRSGTVVSLGPTTSIEES